MSVEKFLKSVHDDKTPVNLIACKDGEIIGDGSLSGLTQRMCHRAEFGIELLNPDVRSDNVNAIHLFDLVR